MKFCLNCGNALEGSRTFCNKSCKNRYYYTHNLFKKHCETCGKEFEGKYGEKYCSPECNIIGQRKNIKICILCGNEYKGRGNSKYCSESCYRLANSANIGLELRTCYVCGRIYKAKKDQMDSICSKECSSKLISVAATRTLAKIKEKKEKNG